MDEKQFFSVLVRGLGVFIFLNGLSRLYSTFESWKFFVASGNQTFAAMSVTFGLIYGVLALALGIAMVRWPEWLVHLAWLERLPTIGRMENDDSSN